VRCTLQGNNGFLETILEAGFDNIMNRNFISHLVIEDDDIVQLKTLL
jgi:hypothetical protein